jgi:hypothetical protein
MMFFQAGPAETTSYMILGFVVIFGTLLLHLISMRMRRRTLERDLEVLKEIKK